VDCVLLWSVSVGGVTKQQVWNECACQLSSAAPQLHHPEIVEVVTVDCRGPFTELVERRHGLVVAAAVRGVVDEPGQCRQVLRHGQRSTAPSSHRG